MSRLGSASGNCWEVGETDITVARPRGTGRLIRLAAKPKPVVLDLAASAMIVIDMQKRFCTPRPDEAEAPTARPVGPLSRLLPQLRHDGVPILWVNWGNRPDKLNLSPGIMHPFARDGGFRPFILDKGSDDAALVPPLAVEPGDIVVDKYRLSGFFDSPLDSILRNLRVTTLLFGGVNIDQCVYATLLDAHCLGYDCLLLSDCCATRSPEFCTAATLWNVERGLGFVTDSDAVLTGQPK